MTLLRTAGLAALLLVAGTACVPTDPNVAWHGIWPQDGSPEAGQSYQTGHWELEHYPRLQPGATAWCITESGVDPVPYDEALVSEEPCLPTEPLATAVYLSQHR